MERPNNLWFVAKARVLARKFIFNFKINHKLWSTSK